MSEQAENSKMEYDDSAATSDWNILPNKSQFESDVASTSDYDPEPDVNNQQTTEDSEDPTSDDVPQSGPARKNQSTRSLTKTKRGRPQKQIIQDDRPTRSKSGQRRKRSEEDVGSNKKSKPQLNKLVAKSESYMSASSHQDILSDEADSHIEECLERITEKWTLRLAEQIEKANKATNAKIDMISESLNSLTGRLLIVETDQKKIATELSEKCLMNENSIIANTNRILALEEALEHEKIQNRALARTVDNLEQTGRNTNMFIAGLDVHQATKEGFTDFCAQNLKIMTDQQDNKSITKIPTERETLHKFVFTTAEIREKYYGARRLLKDHRNIWFRDDLIKKRENLAKQIREMVKAGSIKKTWTDRGAILIIRNGEERPTRINDYSDI